MGSTFMLCTVDQESGVTWHISPNVYALLGSASSGEHTGNGFDWPAKLLSNPVALQGMLFEAKARPTASNCGWRQQGHAAVKYTLQ